MDPVTAELINRIEEFVQFLDNCAKSESDKLRHRLYEREKNYALSWFHKLLAEVNPQEIADDIISNRVSKYFLDYFKGGRNYDLECEHFVELQEYAKKVKALNKRSSRLKSHE